MARTNFSFYHIGFSVATKMLQLFRRPDDPKEYFEMYMLPVALLSVGVAAGSYYGLGEVMRVRQDQMMRVRQDQMMRVKQDQMMRE